MNKVRAVLRAVRREMRAALDAATGS
jgi:hypothetical protein